MHDKLQELLQLTNDSRFPSASEWHGVLCGTSMLLNQRGAQAVVAELARALDLHQESYPSIAEALEESLLAMAADEFQFEPYLPDDDASLEIRTLCLADWCGGFVSACNELLSESQDPDVLEVIQDLIQISKAEVVSDESENVNENAYFELVEYVRITVQMLFMSSQISSNQPVTEITGMEGALDDEPSDDDFGADYSERLH